MACANLPRRKACFGGLPCRWRWLFGAILWCLSTTLSCEFPQKPAAKEETVADEKAPRAPQNQSDEKVGANVSADTTTKRFSPIECPQGTPTADGLCQCGTQTLNPSEAQFWVCLPATEFRNQDAAETIGDEDEKSEEVFLAFDSDSDSVPEYGDKTRSEAKFTCFRSSGCYVNHTRYPQGTVFDDNQAWCGAHPHPGGLYTCEWNDAMQELQWQCQGTCQCGNIKVQIVDGQVIGGDLPYGFQPFYCDDADGKAPHGHHAMTGERDYCGDVAMGKGQTCRYGAIYCGTQQQAQQADAFDFTAYACEGDRMICANSHCICGDSTVERDAECRDGKPFCDDTPYPVGFHADDFICVADGWICRNPSGCVSESLTISPYAIYRDSNGWCGETPQFPHAENYVCVEGTWLCKNPKGCRFQREPKRSPCFATHNGVSCKSYKGMTNTSSFEIALKTDKSDRLTSPLSYRFTCQSEAGCKCGKETCGKGFACLNGACLCGDYAFPQSSTSQCFSDISFQFDSHTVTDIVIQRPPACDNDAIKAPNAEPCVDSDTVSATLIAATTPLDPTDEVFIRHDITYKKHTAFIDTLTTPKDFLWFFLIHYYRWNECHPLVDFLYAYSPTHLFNDLRQIDVSIDDYICKEQNFSFTFQCRAEECYCRGNICKKGDYCDSRGCISESGTPQPPVLCHETPMKYGEKCLNKEIVCYDPVSKKNKKKPQDAEGFQCKPLPDGSFAWLAQSENAQCGGQGFGRDYECLNEIPFCGGAPYPGKGYQCRRQTIAPHAMISGAPSWVCEDPNGCLCHGAYYAQHTTCQTGKKACTIPVPDENAWFCQSNGLWQCANPAGCPILEPPSVLCPFNAQFDGASCRCGDTPIESGKAVCSGDAWICDDEKGCLCRRIRILKGETCTPDTFVHAPKSAHIFQKDIHSSDFSKNTRPHSCGDTTCPAYTICYRDQCLFQATSQRVAQPTDYRSVRGFPQCHRRSGCDCQGNTCKYGEFCNGDRCLAYPTYGLCQGKPFPILKKFAIQRTRLHHSDDFGGIAWRSLFERIPDMPDHVYSNHPPLIFSIPNALPTASYQPYVDPGFYTYQGISGDACDAMPDKRHIDSYEYWMGFEESYPWDEVETELPEDIAAFENTSPFIPTNDAKLSEKAKKYLRYRDHYTHENRAGRMADLFLAPQAALPDFSAFPPLFIPLKSAPIGWVCAEKSCSCGTTTCQKGELCRLLDQTYTCSVPIFDETPVQDEERYILTVPFLSTDVPFDEASDDNSEDENEADETLDDMTQKGYHEYRICRNESGCSCGSQTCIQDSACVDNRYCQMSCPPNANASQRCIIPYKERNCPGAASLSPNGLCVYNDAQWLPRMYRFHPILGAQCQSESCPCQTNSCKRHQWCTVAGKCIDGD